MIEKINLRQQMEFYPEIQSGSAPGFDEQLSRKNLFHPVLHGDFFKHVYNAGCNTVDNINVSIHVSGRIKKQVEVGFHLLLLLPVAHQHRQFRQRVRTMEISESKWLSISLPLKITMRSSNRLGYLSAIFLNELRDLLTNRLFFS